jgi:tetratricopeptide (TPR) repeat protein
MLEIATEEESTDLMVPALVGLMDGACLTGNLLEARLHAAAIANLAMTSPDREGFDRSILNTRARWCEASVLWYLGYPDQAANSGFQALKLIRSWDNALQLAQLLNNCHPVFLLSGDLSTARRFAEESLSVADRFGLRNQLAWATFNLGQSLVFEGKPDQGVPQMLLGMAGHEEAGNRIKTWMLAPLANGYRLLGDTEKGLDMVDRALAMANETGELLWKSEILRLKGELILLDGGATSEAERLFKQAIGVAQAQAAKSWELRASLSLARLLRNHGKRDLVGGTLKPICDWFTEGFRTPDFIEAKSFLAAS